MDQATFEEAMALIRQFAEKVMAEREMPGLQIAITDHDELRASINLGYANLESKTPVVDETRFEFGSIGKSFTAICLLQLEAEGKVDLHAAFETQLPWWSVQSDFNPITAHHLLSHSAGIICGTDASPEQRTEVWAMRNSRTTHAPGTHFHYSNVGYKALGLLIEHVTGRTYAEVVQERILNPLGMANTVPVITAEHRHHLAQGYQDYFDDRPRIAGRGVFPAPWLETDSGDGCICASASDLAIYLRMLMNRGAYPGGRILTEDQFMRMASPVIAAHDVGDESYGYGLFVPSAGLPGRFGHSGGMVGYISHMDADLDTGFGVTVFTNSMNGVSRISTYALDVLKAAEADEPFPEFPVRNLVDTAAFTGTFINRTSSIQFAMNGDDIELTRGGEIILLQKSLSNDDNLIDSRPGHDIFPYAVEKDDERVVRRITHGPDEWVPEGQPLPAETDPALARLAGHYRSYNPWQSNFRLVARGSALYRIFADGSESRLERWGEGWTGASGEDGPEFFWVDVHVDGKVAEVRDQLGGTWQLVFTP